MLYAKVVFGLPIEGPFDYIVPACLHKNIKPGFRVLVPFGHQKKVGYVVALTRKTSIKNLRALIDLLDDAPLLGKFTLLLTKELAEYYCCSWGEAIETAIPAQLRKARKFLIGKIFESAVSKAPVEVLLLQDLEGRQRWECYLAAIKEVIAKNKSAIILLPDVSSVLKARELVSLKLDCEVEALYRRQLKAVQEWKKIREGRIKVVVGTRSAVFAPFDNLGLIIIDEEQDSVYKQDQVPHYHAREVALMRAKLEGAKIILGSVSPSLESFYLCQQLPGNNSRYQLIPRQKPLAEIKIIDTRNVPLALRGNRGGFSKYFADLIAEALAAKSKILLFVNRRGFATFVSCPHCHTVIRCQRCNTNLVYHFKENILSCHYCNFKMQPPTICPHCNSAYIRYSGTGTEKIESELSREFPQAAIKMVDNLNQLDMNAADIFIATEGIFNRLECTFDLSAALFIDNSLNRHDLRAAEKTLALLLKLLEITKSKMYLETGLAHHHCFRALAENKISTFYEEELKQRRQLDFPPYQHLALVKIRGLRESRVRETAEEIFKKLNKANKGSKIKIMSVNPAQPSKLRGNFYWQILLRSDNAKRISRFLKMHLKDRSYSGIIVTVDVDPL